MSKLLIESKPFVLPMKKLKVFFRILVAIQICLGSDFLFLPITPEIDDPEDNPLLPIKDVTTESSLKEEVSSEMNSDDKIKQLKRKKSLKKNSKSKKNKI